MFGALAAAKLSAVRERDLSRWNSQIDSHTVTIEIKGLPNGCPNSASETSFGDPEPEAVKLNQISGSIFLDNKFEMNKIVRLVNDNPNDQLYVFFSYKKSSLPEVMYEHQEKTFKYLTANGLDGSRITFQSMQNGVELMQFWRVPPGASNPTCDECDESVCPTISITGPAGVTVPGETLKFTVDTNLKDLDKLNYKWAVSDGTIIEGQGKPWIHVQTTPEIINETITAKVTVEGRPEGCVNSAESTAAISLNFHPHASDEFGKLKAADEMVRLDAFVISLLKEPKFNGYIVARFPKSTDASAVQKRIKRMKDHIFIVRKIPRDRVVILVGSSERDSTVLWLLPTQYGESICPECKMY